MGDDGFGIKSGRDEEGRALARPSEDITLHARPWWSGRTASLVIGSEISGGVRHIRVQVCEGIGTQLGIRIKSMRGRGNVVEDIVASNLRLRNVRHRHRPLAALLPTLPGGAAVRSGRRSFGIFTSTTSWARAWTAA